MVTYIATVFAKKGHEEPVTQYYQEQAAQLESADGFISCKILRAMPGTMKEAVSKYISKEEMAKHAEAEGPDGTHLVIVEEWESADLKTKFSRSVDNSRMRDLIPHLLPEHTHEYYEDVTPG